MRRFRRLPQIKKVKKIGSQQEEAEKRVRALSTRKRLRIVDEAPACFISLLPLLPPVK